MGLYILTEQTRTPPLSRHPQKPPGSDAGQRKNRAEESGLARWRKATSQCLTRSGPRSFFSAWVVVTARVATHPTPRSKTPPHHPLWERGPNPLHLVLAVSIGSGRLYWPSFPVSHQWLAPRSCAVLRPDWEPLQSSAVQPSRPRTWRGLHR